MNDASARMEAIRTRVEGMVGIPSSGGNRIEVLRNGVEIFPAMLEAIESARHTIELLTFVYWRGEIAERMAEALAARARDGLKVRVLLDGFGARPMRRELVKRMASAGCDVRWFRPLETWKLWQITHRTHRKVLIIDSRIGFTGGVGIAEEWMGDARDPSEWRDDHFRVQGPAVSGLRAAFFGNWIETRREGLQAEAELHAQETCGDSRLLVVRSTAGIGWTDMAILLDALIASAKHTIRISTAYFAPDRPWEQAFARAVERGVKIQVMIPGPYIDRRVSELAGSGSIEEMLRVGVEIHRYQRTMLHAKVMLVDGVVACLGSPNFNQRSVGKDDEVAVVAFDPTFTALLDQHFEDDLEQCVAMELGSYQRRSLWRRFKELLAQPVQNHV